MSETDQLPEQSSPIGWVVALVLLFVPGLIEVAVSGPHTWDFALIRGTLLALPFAYLGWRGTNSRRPWLVSIGLTVCFWVTPVVIAALTPDSPGILTFETLLGVVMLASPVMVIAGARSVMQSKTGPSA